MHRQVSSLGHTHAHMYTHVQEHTCSPPTGTHVCSPRHMGTQKQVHLTPTKALCTPEHPHVHTPQLKRMYLHDMHGDNVVSTGRKEGG